MEAFGLPLWYKVTYDDVRGTEGHRTQRLGQYVLSMWMMRVLYDPRSRSYGMEVHTGCAYSAQNVRTCIRVFKSPEFECVSSLHLREELGAKLIVVMQVGLQLRLVVANEVKDHSWI